MLEGITQWIKHIILVVMFTAFVGFLLPKNQFLKYANVLLGLIVMMTMATPLISLLRYDFSVNELQWIFEDFIQDQDLTIQTDSLDKRNKAILLRKYKDNIDTAIYQQLQGFDFVEVIDVKSSIIEDVSQKDIGRISDVEVVLRLKKPGKDNSRMVERIEVGVKQVIEEDSLEIVRIQEYIQNQLGIPVDKIHLRWEG